MVVAMVMAMAMAMVIVIVILMVSPTPDGLALTPPRLCLRQCQSSPTPHPYPKPLLGGAGSGRRDSGAMPRTQQPRFSPVAVLRPLKKSPRTNSLSRQIPLTGQNPYTGFRSPRTGFRIPYTGFDSPYPAQSPYNGQIPHFLYGFRNPSYEWGPSSCAYGFPVLMRIPIPIGILTPMRSSLYE